MKLTYKDWESIYFGSNELVYKFTDENGNCLYWQTASNNAHERMDNVRKGETIEVTCKITNDTYTDNKGVKQTKIKNVRFK